MRVRRRFDRLSSRLFLFVSLASAIILLLQHHLLERVTSQTAVYGVLSDLIPKNDVADVGSSTSSNNSTSSSLRFHTCSIFNRRNEVPIAPQFIIVGAQKSGTTALYEFLNEHPTIQASKTLEPHFFDWHYPSNEMKHDWLIGRNLSLDIPEPDFQCAIKQAYGENFAIEANTSADTIFFEKTPSYLFLTKVPKRIYTTCFWHPKIVIILRNPIDRAFSHFRMKIKTGDLSFEAWIDKEVQHLVQVGLSRAPPRTSLYSENDPAFQIPKLTNRESEERHWKHYRKMFANNYVQRGMYITYLRHWIKFFPLGESLLVLNFEKFKSNPEEVFFELLDFVGAPRFVPADNFGTIHNSKGRPRSPIPAETRKYLSALFRPYNSLLADELGEDWRGIWD